MQVNKIHCVFFSATGTTETIVEFISKGMGINSFEKYDLIQGQSNEVSFSKEDLVIFAVPVYSGRIPNIAIESLNKFKGNETPAICTVVYGNREYDDALLELRNVVQNNHFKLISLGAFVAEHSIFPAVAYGRPDEQDKSKAKEFGKESMAVFKKWNDSNLLSDILVKGNFPYREVKAIPLKPKGNCRCNKCRICVKECPTQAIASEHPRRTNKSRCISCAHCINVCPQKARHFSGILYKIVGKKFFSAYGKTRKEPEFFFPQK